MRRSRQLLDAASSTEILMRGTNGILSLVDTDGEPYGVPLSFAFDPARGTIYFHCARSGHKLECIGAGCRCSFCVVERDDVMPETFTTHFCSVIAAGFVAPVTDPDEVLHGLLLLCAKYSPGIDPTAEIEHQARHVTVLRLDVSRLTGKQSIELVKN